MTKTELEEKIKNGESVWFFYKNNLYEMCDNFTIKIVFRDFSSFIIGSYKFSGDAIIIRLEDNEFNREHFSKTEITNIIKTKAEAEHYLHHANITRTEQLPFLTWEEFKEGKELRFYNGKYRYKMNWSVDPEIIVIKRYLDFDIDEFLFNERLTEVNFYKAYDECVRLFRGDSDV